jgi:hypothetical protein
MIAMTITGLTTIERSGLGMADRRARHAEAAIMKAQYTCVRGTEIMCGIVGVISTRPAPPILVEALRRLEYRGYGPIALIDRSVPVIAVAPSGPLFEKTASNLQEAAPRGGQVIVFSDAAGRPSSGNRGRDGGVAGRRSPGSADPLQRPAAASRLSPCRIERYRSRSPSESSEVGYS